ncbi:MAG TPA: hypothetical protein PKU83_06290 [Chryseolinea sp.]|nr:hypothetical protein [Chryseolinea sp.]
MKRNSPQGNTTLGCTDKPCSCGCKECKSQSTNNTQSNSIMRDFDRSYSIQSGYAKPSAEQYDSPVELEPQSSRTSSGFNKKELSPVTATIVPSGYGKKEIVKVDPAPKEFEILKRESKLPTSNRQDNTGVFVAAGAFGLMVLIAVVSQEKDKRKN